MATTKKLGVWMDYSSARIMEFSENTHEIETIESKFKSKLKSKERGEKHLHLIADQCKADYFKKITSIISKYDKVLLFGPTDAKKELFNKLSEDHRFVKIRIYLKQTGKMTLNQRNRYLFNYFSSPLYR
ncbi:hypothetical protein [Flavobacterium terrigena]|uniref:Uncharacterized protein n=1 Tax=Flavobacterium terrigena TaxID=402734 RepID=A0A1H6QJU7_9FLAO|nr:hypothetical protein [Flavobacterium terrigena]SEI40387.1 hypothetical protein SAMN05660918_0371 [Flavobacterium terrigena]